MGRWSASSGPRRVWSGARMVALLLGLLSACELLGMEWGVSAGLATGICHPGLTGSKVSIKNWTIQRQRTYLTIQLILEHA